MTGKGCDLSRRSKPSVRLSVKKGRALSESELIGPDEPAPYELIEGAGDCRVIFVCDHASNRFPAALGHLGVPARYLNDHIAWDIGAAGVTRRLRKRFAADALFANYSRLVIDLNRRPGDWSVIPALSDGVLIAGNLSLTQAERDARGEAFHRPYHEAIEQRIKQRIDQDRTGARLPVFIGIHSFTPKFHTTPRPWHAGILWDRDPRLAVPLLASLRARGEFFIGDNEPYSGRHTADYSIDTHAETRGMAHVGIEIRQDLISDETGQDRWAGILGDALEPILADDAVYAALSPVNPMT
jgi:predicted N-formylglutamate amidohydrolase